MTAAGEKTVVVLLLLCPQIVYQFPSKRVYLAILRSINEATGDEGSVYSCFPGTYLLSYRESSGSSSICSSREEEGTYRA